MPYYYCGTCSKKLERQEQRHNYEQTTIGGPIVLTQLNLPGNADPVIGTNMSRTTTRLVVRCVKCGSDAYAQPTDEEKAEVERQTEREKQEANENWRTFGLVSAVFLFVVLIVVLMSVVSSRVEKQRKKQAFEQQELVIWQIDQERRLKLRAEDFYMQLPIGGSSRELNGSTWNALTDKQKWELATLFASERRDLVSMASFYDGFGKIYSHPKFMNLSLAEAAAMIARKEEPFK